MYPGGGKGTILYLKPSYFGNLPVDVLSYGSTNETFPHESTDNQWFSESQFESYRRLGFYYSDAIASDTKETAIADFFAAASRDYSASNR